MLRSSRAVLLLFPIVVAAISLARVRADEVPAQRLTRDVDAILAKAWIVSGVTVAPDATDSELCRRLHLDVVGRTPSEDESRAFLADNDPAKLEKLADRLLGSPEHARHMADELTVLLLGREWQREGLSIEPFRAWLGSRLATDTPLDQIAREILTANGKATENPATYYLLGADLPPDLAGRTARIFLGRRIQCAQCHDHPYEPWHRADFWAAASFFQRVRREAIREPTTKEMLKKKIQPRVIDWVVKEAGGDETRIPLQPGEEGRPQLALPRFLGGTYDLELMKPNAQRLPALAHEILERERKSFARAIANRLFAHLFGRGVVHPIDDFSETHPPSVAGLLERLGAGLEEESMRERPFLRALVLTRAYARTAGPHVMEATTVAAAHDAHASADAPKQVEDPALGLFARMRHKPLSPEAALRSLITATRVDDVVAIAEEEQGRDAVLDWTRRKNDMHRRWVALLGRAEGDDPHAVEESIPHALVLLNGPDVNDLCTPRKGSTVARALDEQDLAARVERLALAAFGRRPTAAESTRWTDFLRAHAKNPAAACQDLFWSMLNSTEFLYCH